MYFQLFLFLNTQGDKYEPVPSSKCVSIPGQYKYNSSPLLNHRLIHVTFLLFQTCFQSDFTMIILEASVNIMFSLGIEPTLIRHVDVCSPFFATLSVELLCFTPLVYA